jgi:hypothetical protein
VTKTVYTVRYEEGHKVTCTVCDSDAPLTDTFDHNLKQQSMCAICYETLLGNAIQRGDGTYSSQGIAQAFNVLIARIEELREMVKK